MRKLLKVAVLFALFGTGICAFGAEVAVLHNGFSIRHEQREIIGSVTRLYITADKTSYVDVPTSEVDHFEADLTPVASNTGDSPKLPDLITSASSRYRLDPDLVNSVIHAESGFNTHAVSRKGAQGLMQLMPETSSKLGIKDAFDPGANVDGGTRYLRELLERYNFDMVKALAAYNAGPLRVEQYAGVPPYRETQAYVARIVRDFNRKKLAEQRQAAIKKNVAAKTSPTKISQVSQPGRARQATLKRTVLADTEQHSNQTP